MKGTTYWGLHVYILRSDGFTQPGRRWIYFPRDEGESRFLLCNASTGEVLERYDSVGSAVDAAVTQLEGNVHFSISRGVVLDSQILISEQHPISTAEEWKEGTSFVTPAGIDQSKRKFLEYLDTLLRSTPPLLRSGCRTLLSLALKFAVLVAIAIFVIKSCSD